MAYKWTSRAFASGHYTTALNGTSHLLLLFTPPPGVCCVACQDDITDRSALNRGRSFSVDTQAAQSHATTSTSHGLQL